MDDPKGYDPNHYPGLYRVRCNNGRDYWPCDAVGFYESGQYVGLGFRRLKTDKDGDLKVIGLVPPEAVIRVTPIRWNGRAWESIRKEKE